MSKDLVDKKVPPKETEGEQLKGRKVKKAFQGGESDQGLLRDWEDIRSCQALAQALSLF